MSRGSWADWNDWNGRAAENYANTGTDYARSYYKDGCALKFSVWQRGWAGGTSLLTLITIVLQVSGLTIYHKQAENNNIRSTVFYVF